MVRDSFDDILRDTTVDSPCEYFEEHRTSMCPECTSKECTPDCWWELVDHIIARAMRVAGVS